MKYLQQTSN